MSQPATTVSWFNRAWRNDYLVVLATDAVLGALGLVSSVLVARSVGRDGRGVLAAVLLWVGVVGAVGTIGLPHALTFYSGRNPASRGFLWRLALRLALLHGLVFGATAAVVVPLIVAEQGAQAAAAARWFAVSVPINLLVAVQLALIQGSGAFRLWSALRAFQAVSYVLILAACWSTAGLTVERALIAQLAAVSMVGCLATLFSRPKFRAALDPPPQPMPRALYIYGLPTLLATVCAMSSTQLDQLVLTVSVPEGQLGLYAVAVSLSLALLPIASAVGSVAITHMARADGGKEQSATARKSVGGVFLVLAVFGIAGAILAEWLVVFLYGESFRDAAPALRILALAAPFLGAGQVAASVLRGGGRPYLAAMGEILGALLTVGLLALLLPRMGILGAAVASLAAYATTFLTQVASIVRGLGIPLRSLLTLFAAPRPQTPSP